MKNCTRLFKFCLALAIATTPILGCGEPPPVPQKDAKDVKAAGKKKVKPGPASANSTDK
jgi:hypothetical protein